MLPFPVEESPPPDEERPAPLDCFFPSVSFGTRLFPSFNLSSPVARVNTNRVYAEVSRGAMAP